MTCYMSRRDWLVHGNTCCGHCGQVPEQHHSDRRCYITDEIVARLLWWQRHGRWPGPDEGCATDTCETPEETP